MSPAVLLPLVLVFAAGGFMSLQAPTNAMLARAGGSPVIAALISFAVGTLALFLVSLASGHRPAAAAFAKVPYYAWFGFYGAFYVAIAAYAAPRIGVASLVTIAIAGQLVMAIALDHVGALGLIREPVTFMKVAGVALVLGGVVLVRKG